MGSELWKQQEFSSTAQQWHKLFSDIAIRISSLDGEFHNQTYSYQGGKTPKSGELCDITVIFS